MNTQLEIYERSGEAPRTEAGFIVRDVVLTRVAYICDGRNAWHSTWVSRYYSKLFCLDTREARKRVEGFRVQGSHWTVKETPALAFKAPKGILIITELNTRGVLVEHRYTTSCPPWLDEIAERFAPEPSRQIVRLVAPGETPLPALTECRIHHSICRGGNTLLDWRDTEHTLSAPDLTSVSQILRESFARSGWLGITFVPVDEGLEVKSVTGPPIAADGLRAGDVIAEVVRTDADGKVTNSDVSVRRARLQNLKPRTPMEQIQRNVLRRRIAEQLRKQLHGVLTGDQLRLCIWRDGCTFALEHTVKSFADVVCADHA